jgi:hypothetical protein
VLSRDCLVVDDKGIDFCIKLPIGSVIIDMLVAGTAMVGIT